MLTLALGIGAATSVFSVAYGILLSPLPMRDPSRIVVLWAHNPTLQPEHFPLWGEEYKALRRESRSFSQSAIYEYHGALERPVQLGDSAMTAGTAIGSGAFFDVLGVRPRLGRLLRADDDVFGAEPVAVISEAFWRRAFGGDTTALGRRVRLYGKTFSIVGVVPGGLDVPRGAHIWMATIGRPKLLLLDEHTAALDPRAAEQIMNVTDDVVRAHSLTTLMVTHSMEQAVRFGDRTIMMHRGMIVADLSGDERRGVTEADLLVRFAELRYTAEIRISKSLLVSAILEEEEP